VLLFAAFCRPPLLIYQWFMRSVSLWQSWGQGFEPPQLHQFLRHVRARQAIPPLGRLPRGLFHPNFLEKARTTAAHRHSQTPACGNRSRRRSDIGLSRSGRQAGRTVRRLSSSSQYRRRSTATLSRLAPPVLVASRGPPARYLGHVRLRPGDDRRGPQDGARGRRLAVTRDEGSGLYTA